MTFISRYIRYSEATKSQTATRKGILNRPSGFDLQNMQYVGQHFFDPMRERFGVPIAVTSFFRCDELNNAIGGSPTSYHRIGAAIDCDADVLGGISNRQIFDFFYYSNLPFSELIWEFGDETQPAWVHIAALKGANERIVKRAFRKDSKTIYVPFDLYKG